MAKRQKNERYQLFISSAADARKTPRVLTFSGRTVWMIACAAALLFLLAAGAIVSLMIRNSGYAADMERLRSNLAVQSQELNSAARELETAKNTDGSVSAAPAADKKP